MVHSAMFELWHSCFRPSVSVLSEQVIHLTLASSYGMYVDAEGNLFMASSDFRSSHPVRHSLEFYLLDFVVR